MARFGQRVMTSDPDASPPPRATKGDIAVIVFVLLVALASTLSLTIETNALRRASGFPEIRYWPLSWEEVPGLVILASAAGFVLVLWLGARKRRKLMR